MRSTHNQKILDNARMFTKELQRESRSDVAIKLEKVDASCREIIQSGGVVTTQSVRAYLSTNFGISIAAQTLSNKTIDKHTGEKKHSPLRQVIDNYSRTQNLLSRSPRKDAEVDNSQIPFLSEKELLSIEDPQVRYKIQLLSGRVRNISNQLNIARTVANLPKISLGTHGESLHPVDHTLVETGNDEESNLLCEDEIEALADFIKSMSMRRRNLSFDEFGVLKIHTHPTKVGKSIPLSKPELQNAIEKIIRKHVNR